MTPEGIVVEEVVRYFSDPRFQKFSIQKEYPIQMGSDNRRADVVLMDGADRLVAVAECKRVGVEGQGLDQLKSYLSATDTRFGIFANSTNPAAWDFYENLGRNQVRPMTRSEFEERVVNGENNRAQPDPQSVRSGSVKHFVKKGGTMLKIRPTVYVGLGTTGTEIINHLRALNHKEYGKAGLPIFRYISIETDAGNNGQLPDIDNDNRVHFGHDGDVPKNLASGSSPPFYELNQVVHTTISDPEPIRARIDNPDSSVFKKDLAGWLSEKILDSEAVRRGGAGAGNLRMAGRLSLWENWNKGSSVKPTLFTAYGSVQHPDHRNEATSFLKGHFGCDIEVDSKYRNIFIVGTLCGGTCSGMLLDIAYYFRSIGDEDTKIYGIFTMFNEGLALGGDSDILLANCYAGLVELDFYKRPETEYRLTLPDGYEIHERGAPFNVATFVSATNMQRWSCVNPRGIFETDQLNQMVARDLFVRSLGVDALIEADLVNAPKRDNRFEKVRDAGRNAETSAFVQYMFSSGVDIVWLPKDELVRFADGEFIQILWEDWKDSSALPGSRQAKELVPEEIVEDIKSALLKSEVGTEAFDTLLENDREVLNETRDVDGAQESAVACLNHLVPRAGGKYHAEFEGKSATYCRQFRERINEAVESFKGYYQLFPKRNFLNEVHGLIQAKLADLEGDLPENLADSDGEVQKMVDVALEGLTSTTKKGFFRKANSEFNHPKFKRRIQDAQGKLRGNFVAFCARETLRNIRSDVEELRRKVDREIDDIDTRFETVVTFLSPGKLSEEIQIAVAHLGSRAYRSEMGSPENREELIRIMCLAEPDAFRWHIRDKLRQSFPKFVPSLIRNIRFDKEAGKRSSPYQEFTTYYKNRQLGFDQAGGMSRLFRYLLAEEEMAESINELKLAQVEPKEVFIPNLRVLYQMEAGYTLDDVRVAKLLKKAYDAAQRRFKRGEDDPIHIHKNPDMFDRQAIRRAQEIVERTGLVKEEWRVLRELLPRIREVDENRFQYVSPDGNFNGTGRLNGDRTLDVGELTIKVVGKAGIRITFSDDEGGWEKLAADAEASDNFIREIRSELGSMLDGFPPDLIELIDDLNGLVGQEESEKFYADYLDLLREHSENLQG